MTQQRGMKNPIMKRIRESCASDEFLMGEHLRKNQNND
jgi:hypothetical protein